VKKGLASTRSQVLAGNWHVSSDAQAATQEAQNAPNAKTGRNTQS
jgi:hypothetical protein